MQAPRSAHYNAIARKIVWTLFIAQCFGSAGFLAAATVTTIAGVKLSGQAAWAGVPSAVYQLGIAIAAFSGSYGLERLGRRGGLTVGLLIGALGSLIASGAIGGGSFGLFLGGLICMGFANSALNLARFAAAEVYLPAERGRAISKVVLGGAAGTLVWPSLSQLLGPVLQRFGFDELVWPYLVSLALFVIAAAIIFILLRPDPRDVGHELAALGAPGGRATASGVEENAAEANPTGSTFAPTRSIFEILRQPAAFVAVMAMVFGQAVMVMIMTITSLYMKDHQHTVPDISLVLSSHVFGMFAFSILSGRLADRFGRGPVILGGAATLILACLVAPLSPDLLPLGFAWAGIFVMWVALRC